MDTPHSPSRRNFIRKVGLAAGGSVIGAGLLNSFLNRCERDDNGMPVIDYFKNPDQVLVLCKDIDEYNGFIKDNKSRIADSDQLFKKSSEQLGYTHFVYKGSHIHVVTQHALDYEYATEGSQESINRLKKIRFPLIQIKGHGRDMERLGKISSRFQERNCFIHYGGCESDDEIDLSRTNSDGNVAMVGTGREEGSNNSYLLRRTIQLLQDNAVTNRQDFSQLLYSSSERASHQTISPGSERYVQKILH